MSAFEKRNTEMLTFLVCVVHKTSGSTLALCFFPSSLMQWQTSYVETAWWIKSILVYSFTLLRNDNVTLTTKYDSYQRTCSVLWANQSFSKTKSGLTEYSSFLRRTTSIEKQLQLFPFTIFDWPTLTQYYTCSYGAYALAMMVPADWWSIMIWRSTCMLKSCWPRIKGNYCRRTHLVLYPQNWKQKKNVDKL